MRGYLISQIKKTTILKEVIDNFIYLYPSIMDWNIILFFLLSTTPQYDVLNIRSKINHIDNLNLSDLLIQSFWIFQTPSSDYRKYEFKFIIFTPKINCDILFCSADRCHKS